MLGREDVAISLGLGGKCLHKNYYSANFCALTTASNFELSQTSARTALVACQNDSCKLTRVFKNT